MPQKVVKLRNNCIRCNNLQFVHNTQNNLQSGFRHDGQILIWGLVGKKRGKVYDNTNLTPLSYLPPWARINISCLFHPITQWPNTIKKVCFFKAYKWAHKQFLLFFFLTLFSISKTVQIPPCVSIGWTWLTVIISPQNVIYILYT